MPSPFPGMDPYLETADLWGDVHHELISQIHADLNRRLRPHYVARVALRIYISDEDNLIDDEIKEARLEIRHLESASVVTIIEILNPTNKFPGSRGRESFMTKRRETLNSEVNWVEIDLLRARFPSELQPTLAGNDYRSIVSRVDQRTQASYWRVSVRQPLPVIGIPLRGKDPDVPIDLGAVLNAAYDDAAYDMSVDYRLEPEPPFRQEDRDWADQLLREAGLR